MHSPSSSQPAMCVICSTPHYMGDKRVKLAWHGTTSFDIADFPLDGSYGQRVCLYEHHEFLQLPDGGGYYRLLADRLLAVPQPQPPAPPKPQSAPQATLSKTTARSRAAAALKRRFGAQVQARQAKAPELRKTVIDAIQLLLSFRDRQQRQAGKVIVRQQPNGTLAATIKLS